MRVEDFMILEIVTVSPGASLKDAARPLVEHHVCRRSTGKRPDG
jgi:hypothetical protein